MAWAIVIGAISAAAGLFNAVDEATSNRAIREKLDKVIDYLQAIDRKIDEIRAQNAEILRKLDELPKIVRAIVQEIVDIALLDERYTTLRDIHLNITTLRRDRDYRITQPGWKNLSLALTYLFDHENRISHIFRLISACELALATTRNQARPFIVALLKGKLALLHALKKDYEAAVSGELASLKAQLDNADYITHHNLNEHLVDFSQLNYGKQPNRQRTVQYIDWNAALERTIVGIHGKLVTSGAGSPIPFRAGQSCCGH